MTRPALIRALMIKTQSKPETETGAAAFRETKTAHRAKE